MLNSSYYRGQLNLFSYLPYFLEFEMYCWDKSLYRQAIEQAECVEVLDFLHKSMPCTAGWQSKTASCKGQRVCLSMSMDRKQQCHQTSLLDCDLQTHKFWQLIYLHNHKNYNFLACDWFKNVLFPLIRLPSCYRTV